MDAEAVDELMRRVEEGFVPIISNAPGFIAYYALDAGEGVVASISIFVPKRCRPTSIIISNTTTISVHTKVAR
jgi:hypothetical protein